MSTEQQWHFSVNTFEVNTRFSNVIMLSLSTDTHAKLKNEEATPAIADILLIYEPVFFAYRDLDQQYGVKSGERKGTTLGFEGYLDQMPLKLRQWESLIRAVYIEDSPEEKAIFPQKRKPFETGTYESRLDALGALKLKTAADPALATANVQITSFYNAALGARLVQQMHEGALKQISDLRENQRELLAGELAGVLGQLMFIYRHNLKEVERYFDLSLLQKKNNDELIFNGNIAGGGTIINLNTLINLKGLNITPATVLRLKNKSTQAAALDFYSAGSSSSPPGPGAQFTLQPGETLDKTIAELGLTMFEFFNIRNNSPFEGNWEIEIL